MHKYFGQILLINSAFLLTYLLGLKTAFANEVSTTYEPSIAQKNTDSQAIDLITNQPNFSNAQNLTQTTEFIPSQPQEADSPKSNVQNPKSNETPLATTTSGVVPVAQVQINPNNLEQIQQYSNENSDEDPMGQVTNVSQFRDVQPSDWAYEALSRIVQNYGCLQGYPDSTYRGNRALSRYEFAAGLNACFKQVEALIAKRPDAVSRQDFETLQRLLEEFRTEVATLGTRVDNLEGRTTFLEQRQFSTTTKLVGEAIFAFTNAFGRNDSITRNTVFQDRVRLDFQTSFTGKDTLHTRFAASNALPLLNDPSTPPFNTGEGIQTFQLTGGSVNNGVVIDWLAYYFPLGSKTQVYIAATAGIHSDYVLSTANPYLESFTGGTGALSHFGEENPIYSIGGGAGAAVNHKFSNALGLSLGYLAGGTSSPASPLPGNGLFNGDYAGLAQLNFNPGGRFQLGLTYVKSYHTVGGPIFNLGGGQPSGQGFGGGTTGTVYANNPVAALTGFSSNPVNANSFGAEASLQLGSKFVISSWFSYTKASITGIDDADIWNYAVTLAFPDLGKKGNLAGIIVGVEPYLGGFKNSSLPSGIRNDVPLHIEGFYKYQLTDNISITPGAIWLTAPNQNADNPDIVIGTLRTTFTF